MVMSLCGTWSSVVCTWLYWNLQSNKQRTNQLLCLDAPVTLTVTHNWYQSLALNGSHQHRPAKSGRSTHTARVNRITEQDQSDGWSWSQHRLAACLHQSITKLGRWGSWQKKLCAWKQLTNSSLIRVWKLFSTIAKAKVKIMIIKNKINHWSKSWHQNWKWLT